VVCPTRLSVGREHVDLARCESGRRRGETTAIGRRARRVAGVWVAFGKTQLAVEFAHRYGYCYGGGLAQLCDLRYCVEIAAVAVSTELRPDP